MLIFHPYENCRFLVCVALDKIPDPVSTLQLGMAGKVVNHHNGLHSI
jgi:hypothetical protein